MSNYLDGTTARRHGEHSLVVRTAAREQAAIARSLVAKRYEERGYLQAQPGQGHVACHAEESLTVCSAYVGHSTVGTIAVRFESVQPLKSEELFAEELAELRRDGKQLCEFSRLAVDGHDLEQKRVLAQLFHMAYLHAHRLAGCDMLVIEVNPRHVSFYRRWLGMEVRSEARHNHQVNAPAVMMTLDFNHARAEIARLGGTGDEVGASRSLYPLFWGPAEEAAQLARMRQ